MVEQLETLKKGDFFTVNRWLEGTDHSYVGTALKVVRVESPFVLFVDRVSSHPYPLDARRVDLQRLSPEYGGLAFGSLRSLSDCESCDGYVLKASDAPYCPSCARERGVAADKEAR